MAARQNRRAFGRRDTIVQAWIKLDGRPKLRCCVRNITPIGAFLELKPPSWLPFKFVLELEHDRTLIGCEFRHTRPTGIGVAFVRLETVAEYKATSKRVKTEREEWGGITRPASGARPAPKEGQADGPSLVARVRASISTKR